MRIRYTKQVQYLEVRSVAWLAPSLCGTRESKCNVRRPFRNGCACGYATLKKDVSGRVAQCTVIHM
jgi:hypothetical protein